MSEVGPTSLRQGSYIVPWADKALFRDDDDDVLQFIKFLEVFDAQTENALRVTKIAIVQSAKQVILNSF